MLEKNIPLVSICIPLYKCENYLLRCLESLKNQTYSNIEIVLVNDCTPDGSVEIAENFIGQNQEFCIKLIHHELNSGLSVVRNTGIDNASGEFIFFLDSDDVITNNCIEELIKTANKTNAEVTIGQNKWINTFDGSVKDFGFPTLAPENFYSDNLEIFEAYCNDLFPITSWNKLFKTSFIRENNIYFVPGLYAQDELWFFHLMCKTETLAINRNITYDYYLHKDSVIFNRTKKNFENYITILEYFQKEYEKKHSEKLKKLIKKKIINFKNLVMILQWKAMRDDVVYWKKNYSRMKKFAKLSFIDYTDNVFTANDKKVNFFQNLPTNLGYLVFKKRYGN